MFIFNVLTNQSILYLLFCSTCAYTQRNHRKVNLSKGRTAQQLLSDNMKLKSFSVKHNLFTLWHLKFFITTAGNTIKRRNNHQVEMFYFKKQNIPDQTQKSLLLESHWSGEGGQATLWNSLLCHFQLWEWSLVQLQCLPFSFTSSNPVRRLTLNCSSPVPSTHNL